MEIRLIALLVCDAFATGPDGKNTLYGLFDVIGCHKLPLRHPQFAIFWKLLSEKPGRITLRIETPSGEPLLTTNPIDFGGNPKGRYQGVYSFSGVEFPVSGEYKVAVFLNDEDELGSIPLTVQEMKSVQ